MTVSMGKEEAVKRLLEHVYGFACFLNKNVAADNMDAFKEGVIPYYYRTWQTYPDSDQWGSIAAWAWTASRVLDYLEVDPDIDATKVAIHGHSRLGKTALWAGASDQRFALVIPVGSGCCGAALSRRMIGETLFNANCNFPHWFCGNPVYELYGVKGMVSEEMPAVNEPDQAGNISFRVRTGGHSVLEYDWELFIKYADKYLK